MIAYAVAISNRNHKFKLREWTPLIEDGGMTSPRREAFATISRTKPPRPNAVEKARMTLTIRFAKEDERVRSVVARKPPARPRASETPLQPQAR